MMIGIPLAYLITFRTYGTWLPGDKNGHVNRFQNLYQTPYAQSSEGLHRYAKSKLKNTPFLLDEKNRFLVLQTIILTCQMHNWDLHAVHVRTNHVHLLITTTASTEIVLATLKKSCSKKLNSVE